MTWLKLSNVGDSATIVVRQLGTEKGRYGMQVHFKGTNGDDIYVPEEIALEWLERCGFGASDKLNFDVVIGATLRFERTAPPMEGDRPHWKIERVKQQAVVMDGAVPPTPPAAEAVGATAPAVARPSPAAGLNDHLPPAGDATVRAQVAELKSLTEQAAHAAADIATAGKIARRADIRAAYAWALEVATDEQLALAKRRKTAPKPTAESIQQGVTTLLLRAERLNAI